MTSASESRLSFSLSLSLFLRGISLSPSEKMAAWRSDLREGRHRTERGIPAPGDEWQCIDLYLWKGKIHETFCEHFSQGNPQKKAPFFHGQNAPSQQENIFFLRANFPGRIPSNSPHSLRILRSPMSHWLPFKQLPISRVITGCWRMQFCYPLKGLCHQIFWPLFLPWFIPIWAPDKQAKVFSNSVLILPRYSIFVKTLSGVNPTA